MLGTIVLVFAAALTAAEKPTLRFLFQPKLAYANSEQVLAGTGYLIKNGEDLFGATCVHFLDFDAGGLLEAHFLDIRTSRPMLTFHNSLGRPNRAEIKEQADIQHDFILLPAKELPVGCSALKLEALERYPRGTKLWFPNKSDEKRYGYVWLDAEVIEDDLHVIKVRFAMPPSLESRSGTPFLNPESGCVIGMLMGWDDSGVLVCPARSIVKWLQKPPQPVPLKESIKKNK